MEKRIKRVLAIILFSLIFVFLLPARESYLETEHFKIIFDEEGRNLAYEVYSFAEETYSYLVSFFSLDPHIYLPVYIDSSQKDFNAYYTSFPYNRIVLYNAPLVSVLDNNEYSFRTTFLHELTHAFTYSFKGGLGKTLVSIFGSWANIPINLHLLLFMQEGISVYTESRDGGGRLNDPFFLFPLVEARMEGKEVSYMDASGGRDIKPYGDLWYAYGGAFSSWMSNRYGERDLGEYYKKIAMNLFSFPQNGYSSLFSSSLWNDWNSFYYSLPVPSSFQEPEIITEESRSYFDISIYEGEVFAVSSSKEGVMKIGGEEEKVFSYYSASPDLSISEEGEFLLPYVWESECSMLLFDKEGKRKAKYKGYHGGTFFDGGFLLSSTSDTITYLTVLNDEGLEVSKIELGKEVTVHEFTSNDKGAFFLLSRKGVERIGYLDKEYKLHLFSTPSEIVFSSLFSSSSSTLSFSWAEKGKEGEVGKYGELNIERGELFLSDKVYLGGVNYPVCNGDKVYFVSSFFDHSGISVATYSDLEVEKRCDVELIPYIAEERKEPSLPQALDYSPLSTMVKGALIPLYMSTFSLYEPHLPLGISYFTLDASESYSLLLSTAYSKSTNSLLFGAQASSSIFSFSFTGDWNPDFFYWESDLALSLSLPLSHKGEKVELIDVLSWLKDGGGKRFNNHFSLSYENYRQQGIGRYHSLGWGIKAEAENLSPSLSLFFSIPSLLPYDPLSPLDYGIPANIHFKVETKGLEVGGTLHLLTYEVQKSIRFLSLYLVHLDMYMDAAFNWLYGSESINRNYCLGLSGVLSPVLGQLSRVQVEFGVELHYNIESGYSLRLILGS